jgi:tetratricopeptide (TPR) repeat protein
LVSVLAVAALVAGLACLGVEWWGRPLAQAEAAVRARNPQAAIERYAAAEARFDRIPVTKKLLPRAYADSIANQLRLAFAIGEYDRIIEKSALSPSTGAIHFWAGCALFEKGRQETKREQRIAWLNRAEDEFRKALERQPDDWDAKFNYELTRHLLAELRPDRNPPPDKLLPLLRPVPSTDIRTRRIG